MSCDEDKLSDELPRYQDRGVRVRVSELATTPWNRTIILDGSDDELCGALADLPLCASPMRLLMDFEQAE